MYNIYGILVDELPSLYFVSIAMYFVCIRRMRIILMNWNEDGLV